MTALTLERIEKLAEGVRRLSHESPWTRSHKWYPAEFWADLLSLLDKKDAQLKDAKAGATDEKTVTIQVSKLGLEVLRQSGAFFYYPAPSPGLSDADERTPSDLELDECESLLNDIRWGRNVLKKGLTSVPERIKRDEKELLGKLRSRLSPPANIGRAEAGAWVTREQVKKLVDAMGKRQDPVGYICDELLSLGLRVGGDDEK